MFTADYLIDTVQNGKKQFVNTFVQHEGIKKALLDFVDGQTEYTKAAAKVTTDVTTRLAKEVMNSATELSKFDASKLFKFAK